MTGEERNHTAKFFKWALPCLRVFTKSGGITPPGEWKEALDAFAGAFTVLGPYDLRTAVRIKKGCCRWVLLSRIRTLNADSYFFCSVGSWSEVRSVGGQVRGQEGVTYGTVRKLISAP